MIVGSNRPLTIGFKGDRITNNEAIPQDQPFVVIRQATFEEYQAQWDDEMFRKYSQRDYTEDFFYEVSTD